MSATKKTNKQIKNFILKTLLPYKEDPSICGYENSSCKYLTKEGNKCALGRWLKEGEWQSYKGTASSLLTKYGFNILKDEAKDMNFTPQQWNTIQNYHDNLSLSKDVRRSLPQYKDSVRRLEQVFGIEFPELR